jgi:hypothetical protein
MYRGQYPYPFGGKFGGHAQSATHHIEVTRLPWNLPSHDEIYAYVFSIQSTVRVRGRNVTANSVVVPLSARVSFVMAILSRIPMAKSCSGSIGKPERF